MKYRHETSPENPLFELGGDGSVNSIFPVQVWRNELESPEHKENWVLSTREWASETGDWTLTIQLLCVQWPGLTPKVVLRPSHMCCGMHTCTLTRKYEHTHHAYTCIFLSLLPSLRGGERGTERERQRYRQTERQRQKQAETEGDWDLKNKENLGWS